MRNRPTPADGQNDRDETVFPSAVVFVDQLPRNAIGKVLKNKLRETYGDVLLA